MKLFVWDFHGVLEKGNERAVLEISNKVLTEFGYKARFTKEDNLKLYGVKWYKYFEYLLPYETEERHFELQNACIKFETADHKIVEKYIQPNDYAHFVLSEVAKKYNQILVSNVSGIALERFIRAVGVDKFFTRNRAFALNSHKNILRKNKKDLLTEYLKGKKYNGVVAIGDTIADMKMGEIKGVVTYLYAHPGRKYPKVKSHYKINDLREVLREL